ncbi:MAG: AMP-binding protein, partial [Deltaproteobacteria bacterium]|jgi:acyl-CoA synthetase (AMP-forming)/AMP-acid ligase II|nr:AMP-binding protein [Deltaproteobacteria bacterium]
VACGLQQRGLEPGQRVALMLPTSPAYFFCFFGVIMAGAIPVPLYPPARLSQIEEHLRRHIGILNNSLATLLITTAEVQPLARLLQAQAPALQGSATLDQLTSHGSRYQPQEIKGEETAFLQYTSGSTGNPKGVILSHANLLANIRAMGHHMEARASDVFVSWLPLYHDMGLIGAWLGSLYYGCQLVIMSPQAFLVHPEEWLWAIHRHRGTLSAAPNFGYAFCLKKIDDLDIEGLDLSSWRLAFNGAEPVSPATVHDFTARFRPFGFAAQAMAPVYGLAESTVGLAFPPPGQPARH